MGTALGYFAVVAVGVLLLLVGQWIAAAVVLAVGLIAMNAISRR